MVDAALPREVLPVLWCQSTLFTDGACPVTTDLIMRVNVRTTTTAALEARNLKTAYQVYIVDYYCYRLLLLYHRLLAHTRYCQEDTYYYYRLLLCHRLVRHAMTRSRKKNCPGIQNPKSSPIFGCVSYLPYVVRVHYQVGGG